MFQTRHEQLNILLNLMLRNLLPVSAQNLLEFNTKLVKFSSRPIRILTTFLSCSSDGTTVLIEYYLESERHSYTYSAVTNGAEKNTAY